MKVRYRKIMVFIINLKLFGLQSYRFFFDTAG